MAQRPNILQITTHDSGRHLGCYGHPTLHTPAIDALAADGVRLGNYFCTAPICCASRASQMTGLYPQSHGLLDLCFPPFNWRIRDEVRHLSQRLKSAGYGTHLFGIQHEVHGSELDRLEFDAVHCRRGESALQIAEGVAGFLRGRGADRDPFFAQVGLFETHTPFDSRGAQPDEELGVDVPPYLFEDEMSRRAMAGYQGAIRQVDAAVEMISSALRDSGLEDETILVFTTDHGIEMPRAKWFLYDPGIAISLIVRYPREAITGGNVFDGLISNVDYLPTIMDLAGLPAPDDLEGRSFAAGLRGESMESRNAVFAMYHKTRSRCVRTDRYSLIRHFAAATDFRTPVRTADVLQKRPACQLQLFDLATDPNQFDNVVDLPEHEAVKRELDGMLWQWMERLDDPLLKGPTRTPAYEAAMADYSARHIAPSHS